MKYSFIMPYLNRADLLHNTLISLNDLYKDRKDYEVVIIEDIKNFKNNEWHEKLLKLLKFFTENADKYIKIIYVKSEFHDCYNPSPLFNLGVEKSSGEFLCITNPEVIHKVNILNKVDELFDKDKNIYIVCGCENIIDYPLNINSLNGFTYTHHSWYQHSIYRNAQYHFCSFLSRENFNKIGGFDLRFAKGIAYDDDSFRDDIKKNNIKFVLQDNLWTLHQAHDSVFNDLKCFPEKLKRNKVLYFLKKQNKSDEYIEEFLNNL